MITALVVGFPSPIPGQSKLGEDRQPMSFEDILSQRKLTGIAISPGGNFIAVLVAKADLVTNRDQIGLYIVSSAQGAEPWLLVADTDASNVQWRPGAGTLTYLTRKGGGALLAEWSISGEGAKFLGESKLPQDVESFKWAPNGKSLALLRRFEQIEVPDSVPRLYTGQWPRYVISGPIKTMQQAIELYDESIIHMLLSKVSVEGGVRIFETPAGTQIQSPWHPDVSVTSYQWARDGSALAITTANPAESSMRSKRTFVASIPNGGKQKSISGVTLRSVTAHQEILGWTLDGSALIARNRGESFVESLFTFTHPTNRLYLVPVSNTMVDQNASRLLTSLPFELGAIENAWALAGGDILFEAKGRLTSTLYRTSAGGSVGTPKQIASTEDRLSNCDVDATGRWVACVREAPRLPPEVALVDLQTGEVRTLTRFNTYLAERKLADVECIRVKDGRDGSVVMYIVYPLDYQPSQLYPGIVLLYGFSNEFVSQAGYITSYPAQVFAARGYITLLWNWPEMRGGLVGDLAAQAFDLRENPVATIRAGVDTLIRRGLVDPNRIGIAGHSMGAIWTSFALDDIGATLSFRAAAIRNPGQYSALGYWNTLTAWRRRLDLIFGGPPGGPTDSIWQRLDMYRLRPPKRVPILREYAGAHDEFMRNLEGTYWQEAGFPIETWVYPHEGHVFFRPRTRLTSMQLHADWFDFWLRGIEHSDPEKAEQYRRWKALRELTLSPTMAPNRSN